MKHWSEIAAQEAAGPQRRRRRIAALEIIQRQQAENAAVDARIAANQAGFQAAQLNTERELLRDNLAAERDFAASNANFGLILIIRHCAGQPACVRHLVYYRRQSCRLKFRQVQGPSTQTARNDANTAAAHAFYRDDARAFQNQLHSEYHPAAPAVKVSPAAKTNSAKTAARRRNSPPVQNPFERFDANSDSSFDSDDSIRPIIRRQRRRFRRARATAQTPPEPIPKAPDDIHRKIIALDLRAGDRIRFGYTS